jgi:putative restriction endonuclease
MRFWVGVTDNRWYHHLAAQPDLDEVNFWHPSGKAPFASMAEGTPFLFKLKKPNQHIAGGGFFVRTVTLPLQLAWDAFAQKNGASSYSEFDQLIRSAHRDTSGAEHEIACSILAQPFFLPRHQWIEVREEFARNIVSGKYFDTIAVDGIQLWEAVQQRLTAIHPTPASVAEMVVQYGQPRLVRPRRGQGAFRALVTNAYGRRCAITGESTLPVLEAAHIKAAAAEGLNNTYNGLLLRSDFHKLFDVGLITVTPEHRVIVSTRIKEQWYNGKAYNSLHGASLAAMPESPEDKPRSDLLKWHNDNVFEQWRKSA